MIRLLLFILTNLLASCEQKAPKPFCDVLSHDGDSIYAKCGYRPYYDIDLAQECSRQTGRPILIVFTCFSCMSSHDLDWGILCEDDVKTIIDSKYILTMLYVDDRRMLEKIDSTQKSIKGTLIKTIGNKNSNFQASQYYTNTQPYFVFVDSYLNKVAEPIGYIPKKSIKVFIKRLKQGLKD